MKDLTVTEPVCSGYSPQVVMSAAWIVVVMIVMVMKKNEKNNNRTSGREDFCRSDGDDDIFFADRVFDENVKKEETKENKTTRDIYK